MSFPGALSGLTIAALLDVFEAAPQRLRDAIANLDEPALTARPVADKWSILEIVAHLADAETVGAVRFRKVLAEPGSALDAYDESAWAVALGYRRLPLDGLSEAVTLFTALRRASIRLLKGLSPTDWQKVGAHQQWGPVTARQLLELYADHGERHLAQIDERRVALGKARAIDPILTAGLY